MVQARTGGASRVPSRQAASISLIGTSPPMLELARKIARVVESDITVAIFGESGTGKELVARAIHAGGPRRGGPFVAINCAAIADSLQDSELFGHERGAFTGALTQRRGCFEQANAGTLFLDELGEMSASTQAKLLRTLEERTIRRLGGDVDVPIDVRIVCATRRDLLAEVASGRFREDLYFRLVVYPIEVPRLCDRRDDIPLIIEDTLRRLAEASGRPLVARVSPEALALLSGYAWPGNVRELINVVHRSLLLCQGDEITALDLPAHLRTSPPKAPPSLPGEPGAAKDSVVPKLRELERGAIERALVSAGGSVGRAAKLLGISRATLYRRMAHRATAPDQAPR